jgi:hypothetical protein
MHIARVGIEVCVPESPFWRVWPLDATSDGGFTHGAISQCLLAWENRWTVTGAAQERVGAKRVCEVMKNANINVARGCVEQIKSNPRMSVTSQDIKKQAQRTRRPLITRCLRRRWSQSGRATHRPAPQGIAQATARHLSLQREAMGTSQRKNSPTRKTGRSQHEAQLMEAAAHPAPRQNLTRSADQC